MRPEHAHLTCHKSKKRGDRWAAYFAQGLLGVFAASTCQKLCGESLFAGNWHPPALAQLFCIRAEIKSFQDSMDSTMIMSSLSFSITPAYSHGVMSICSFFATDSQADVAPTLCASLTARKR